MPGLSPSLCEGVGDAFQPEAVSVPLFSVKTPQGQEPCRGSIVPSTRLNTEDFKVRDETPRYLLGPRNSLDQLSVTSKIIQIIIKVVRCIAPVVLPVKSPIIKKAT